MTSKIEQLSVDDLLFDYQNPRLSELGVDPQTPQEEMMVDLWDIMGAEEVYLSIAASGFFEHEPLIAIPATQTGKYIIIEGNRRLAAVKAILTPGFVEKHAFSRLPLISAEIKQNLHKIPCIITTREQAWRFIGFKHVNGPAKWGSYAKAKFIAQVKKDHNLSIQDIAKQIGDTTQIAGKLYQAFLVIEQAENANVFDINDVPSKRLFFSHLYNGLNHENIKKFIGLKDFNENNKDVVPAEKLKELGELLTWMFGSQKNDLTPLIKSQNPDLKYLGEALGNRESIAALRSKQSLSVAYELSLSDYSKFEQSLNDAKRGLYDAQKYLPTGFDVDNQELLQTAKSITSLANAIFDGMKRKSEASV